MIVCTLQHVQVIQCVNNIHIHEYIHDVCISLRVDKWLPTNHATSGDQLTQFWHACDNHSVATHTVVVTTHTVVQHQTSVTNQFSMCKGQKLMLMQ